MTFWDFADKHWCLCGGIVILVIASIEQQVANWFRIKAIRAEKGDK